MGRTFLFARPGFLTGWGRTIDLGGMLERSSYNISATPEEADLLAILNDWWAVGKDLRKAVEGYRVEPASR
jgi:hypothetical protein